MTPRNRPRIVIIGAGFGGLFAARKLANTATDVTLIDRQNYHTFTPLLYQVATAGLDPSEIAYPIRSIFRGAANVRPMMGDVQDIDTDGRTVQVKANGFTHHVPYDYLIIAAGSVTHYFGNEAVAAASFGLKDLGEAVVLRNHILKQFERAAWSADPDYRGASATMVVVGGGPTGLETAGALHELSARILQKEFAGVGADFTPRVILVEATDRLLRPYPEGLQAAAHEQLTSLGVDVVLNDPVEAVNADAVTLRSGRVIPTHTLIWSAGVKGSPLAETLGVPLVHGGRVSVLPTLDVAGLEGVYVVGDLAYVDDGQGDRYPQMIPVAKQQGIQAAENILRQVRGEASRPFRYTDRGIMATIGRSRAVAWLFNRVPLRGYVAWIAWLGLHLLWLMGFRNQLNVLVNWVWNYFTYDRSVRIILEPQHPGASSLPEEMQQTLPEADRVPELPLVG